MTRVDRISMWLLIGCTIAFLLLFGQLEELHGQTMPRPDQIRNWQQVAPPGQVPTGGQIRLDQLAIAPGTIAAWTATVATKSYHHYNIAVVPDQPDPILIVCARATDDPLGPGCVGGVFWFAAK